MDLLDVKEFRFLGVTLGKLEEQVIILLDYGLRRNCVVIRHIDLSWNHHKGLDRSGSPSSLNARKPSC